MGQGPLLKSRVQRLEFCFRIVFELVLNFLIAEHLPKARPQGRIGKQAVERGTLNETKVAVIAVVASKPDEANGPSDCDREVIGRSVWLENFVGQLEVCVRRDTQAVDRRVDVGAFAVSLFEVGDLRIFAVPAPRPRLLRLLIDDACLGQGHYCFDLKALFGLTFEEIGARKRGVTGRAQEQSNRFKDSRLSDIPAAQDDIKPLAWSPFEGLHATILLDCEPSNQWI